MKTCPECGHELQPDDVCPACWVRAGIDAERTGVIAQEAARECTCSGTAALSVGDSIRCSRCGLESAAAIAGAIDDVFAMAEYVVRHRDQLAANGDRAALEAFGRRLLPWSISLPRRVVQRTRPPLGMLRQAIANDGLLSNEQLIEAVRALSKRAGENFANEEVMDRVVVVVTELSRRGVLKAVATIDAVGGGRLRDFVQNTFAKTSSPIDRTIALTGWGKKTIENLCAEVNRQGASLDTRDRRFEELREHFVQNEHLEGMRIKPRHLDR